MRILGDTDTQDVGAIGGEFPGGLMAHAIAQVILFYDKIYLGGVEARLELTGFQTIIKNQRPVGFGQPPADGGANAYRGGLDGPEAPGFLRECLGIQVGNRLSL